MNDFDPGEGWREVQYGHELSGHEHITWDSTGSAGGTSRMWVREEPVPPLPTEPGYYVDADGCAWRLDVNGEWDDTFGNPFSPGSAEFRLPLERYEPRRETVDAVLGRVAEENALRSEQLDRIAEEFGLSS